MTVIQVMGRHKGRHVGVIVLKVMGRHEGRRYVAVYKHFGALKLKFISCFVGRRF